MKRLIQAFNEKTNNEWGVQNEYIIALSVFLFSLALFAVYQGVIFSADDAPIDTNQTSLFVTIFPIFCALRLFIIFKSKSIQYFGFFTATIDTLLLSCIIFMFSQQYGTAAATLKSPSFVFYFVLNAFHAMRFKPRLILINGGLSIAAWSTIVVLLQQTTTDITHSYTDYVTSSSILIGAEVEKLFALAAFTVALYLCASRAKTLYIQKKSNQEKLAAIQLQEKISVIGLEEEKRTSRMKSEFLNTMSHELRTPMNGILGMVQTLRLTPLNNRQEDMLGIMQKSGDQLTTILNNILDFSHIGDDRMKLTKDHFDLNETIKTASAKMTERARQKNIDLIIKIHPSTPLQLIGDDYRIIQILEHFLDNAIKFTYEGHIRLFVHGTQQDGQAELSFEVHDTGIGIDRLHFEDIFKPFHQIDGSITREYGGTGMGLALCKRLVDIMKGEIIVQSILGFGSVFTMNLCLPIVQENSGSLTSENLLMIQKTG
ncbi:MAG: ATP-binding protein [Maricaulaceae bacterium]